MATATRQPFAPLDGARLQNLTSLKNRQNALSISPGKRKASDSLDTDDFENVDPLLYSKRPKGSDSTAKDSALKPSAFILTKSASTNDIPAIPAITRAKSPVSRPRSMLNPKSPVAKINTGVAKSSPLSAPAGRSPTRGKKTGILSSRRRTGRGFARVDPPAFDLSKKSAAPFSLDAALRGTLSGYGGRNASPAVKSLLSNSLDFSGSLEEGDMKSSWFFDIHEDTPEQEMTNLLQHSTCVLDISSDEENESRRQRERAEGKENVPPMDDVSQTSRPRAVRQMSEDEMVFEKERNPLGEMNVRDYYSEGCDENSIIIVPGDDEEDSQPQQAQGDLEYASDKSAEPDVPAELINEDGVQSVDELMQKTDEPAPGAAVLEPMEGTGESFEVWESGSAKDEAEMATTEVAQGAEC
ncbi:uncharacterized protein GGS22DRAFT_165323 [Annulohypoxylon maeteangense]|uniref:uncharacterized protein n=1 Tax=Annulohypoxylon maeteangense TaxID=1927788 RepID=UPI0020085198|nr:uncharacterized protein GGS22DRAFT_165323 [Annulohypoxylon maeteangense]KAI0884304.1 hypothetical protein GGS22DRAFT_165323 [Annulohypoxylon maeteangense]